MSRFPSSLSLLWVMLFVATPLLLGPASHAPVAQAAGTFVVTSTADTAGSICGADCTLRQAINAANAASGGTIVFAIPTTDPNYRPGSGTPLFVGRSWVIRPGAIPLPPLGSGVTIDGSTQAAQGSNPIGPEIVIDGTLATGRNGLTINGNDNTVLDVAIINFNSGGLAGVGIAIAGSRNTVRGTFIGVDADGITPGGNGFAGIWIQGAANANVIGGRLDAASETNIVSGNDLDGIVIQGNGNFIRGNYIGTNFGGTSAIPNNGSGVLVYLSNSNIIGPADGQSNAYFNFISGNREYGVLIDGGSNNRVAGNIIGIGIDGSGKPLASLPNARGGIEVRDFLNAAANNRIGLADASTSSPYRNFIAGNTGPGIRLRGATTTGTSVVNNWVGLNREGYPLAATNNTGGGIVVGEGVSGVTIGGANPGERNVISGNAGDGIIISGQSAAARTVNNTIAGNYIGTSTTGSFATPSSGFPNTRSGIVIGNYTWNTTIGDVAPNLIGYNLSYGVAITGTDTLTTTVAGNTIRYNALDGVYAATTGNLRVAGSGGPSVIGNNGQNGVRVANGALLAFENLTLSNNGQNGLQLTTVVTTTISAVTASGNGVSGAGDGARITGARLTTISGSTFNTNREHGIRFTDGVTTTLSGLTLQQNQQNGMLLTGPLVNTQIASTQVISNSLRGIAGSGAMDGLALGPNNTVTGNAAAGIDLALAAGAVPVRNIVIGNNQFNRNAFSQPGYALRVAGGTNTTTIAGNGIDANRNGGGIAVENADRVVVTGNEVRRSNGPGIAVAAGSVRVSLESNTLISNTVGIEVNGVGTDRTTLQGNNILTSGATGLGATGSGIGVSVVDAQRTAIDGGNNISSNLGAGVHVRGSATLTLIRNNTITDNALGVLVGAPVGSPGAPPYPQQTRIVNNSISRNGIPPAGPFPVNETLLGRGIVLNPETVPGGAAGNPNNDIDPPVESSLRISAAGVLTGQVNTASAPGGCAPVGATRCLVQIFRPDQTTRDGQGLEGIGQVNVNPDGTFSFDVGSIPRQLTLTATDPVSNTSRFAIFAPRPSLTISAPQTRTVNPGDPITYTHTLVNNGNMELANVQLTVTTSRGWERLSPPIGIQPSGSFSLAPGASRPVTITLRAPTGGIPEAAPGTDLMTVRADATVNSGGNTYTATASLVNQTTLNAKIVLELTPATAQGRGDPGVTVPYAFQVRNTGNVPATVNLTRAFDDPVVGVNWQATLSTSSLVIPAGETRGFQLNVRVPPEGVAPIAGTAVGTTITMTPTSPVDATQVRTARVTTVVGQISRAQIRPSSDEKPGAAEETVIFVHEITNNGTGDDIFQIVGTSSLGSAVRFSLLSGGVITPDPQDPRKGTFPIARDATVTLKVEVTVSRFLTGGAVEEVFIELKDRNGNNIGGAFAQDRVRVTRGVVRPWLWLPIVVR